MEGPPPCGPDRRRTTRRSSLHSKFVVLLIAIALVLGAVADVAAVVPDRRSWNGRRGRDDGRYFVVQKRDVGVRN